jgi:hypothetical protein
MARRPGAKNYSKHKVIETTATISAQDLQDILDEQAEERFEFKQALFINNVGLKLIFVRQWV